MISDSTLGNSKIDYRIWMGPMRNDYVNSTLALVEHEPPNMKLPPEALS